MILDALGVTSVAAVVGGSLGGMATLEWPLCTPPGYVQIIVPIATSSCQSAWGISWNEAQREAIRGDGAFLDGWYTPVPEEQPICGLGAARMIGMLTYRSYQSFEARFHRKPAAVAPKNDSVVLNGRTGLLTPPYTDGCLDGGTVIKKDTACKRPRRPVPKYSAQNYMQYQAQKFLKRFDANCYISMLDKMDSHDVTRGRLSPETDRNEIGPTFEEVQKALSRAPPRALVISIETDVLFTNEHQIQLARCLPDARFVNLDSEEGHDGFLLEFEALSDLMVQHFRRELPWAYEKDFGSQASSGSADIVNSVFGEVEVDF